MKKPDSGSLIYLFIHLRQKHLVDQKTNNIFTVKCLRECVHNICGGEMFAVKVQKQICTEIQILLFV